METSPAPYTFEGGYPTPQTVQRAYDDADLGRAVTTYRFFFPTVSGAAIYQGNLAAGAVPNQVFGAMETRPEQVGLTLNSDTPYGPLVLDLHEGPVVVELPPGPLVGVALDVNQRWLADMGLAGPDGGRGGSHLLLPPDWDGTVPDGHHVARSGTHRVIGGLRAIPQGGDLGAAMDLLTRVKVRPLVSDGRGPASWVDVSSKPQDTTPFRWEESLEYWRVLHEVLDTEPPTPGWEAMYGELAALGIVRGRPFAPDERTTRILELAARTASGQLRVQSLADRRPDRIAWPGTHWEWATLEQDPEFRRDGVLDSDAREKWFFQAIGVSPAMMRREAGAGSLYWLGTRDAAGNWLDGRRTYRLVVPQPVPAELFWSLTVYDARTRSQITTPQGRAAIRSLFELAGEDPAAPVELWFGPEDPGVGGRWIRTVPGAGWFSYVRLYGPRQAAFDGSWRLPDPEQTA
ncbi:DUF1254 domain-containing protein [Geodermatophilus sp. SYSU D00814]